MAGSPGDEACPRLPLSSADPGQDRALASDAGRTKTISNARSPPSWRITTMPAITRASTILPRRTSTSDALRPSSLNAERIKRQTIANRRLQHHLHAA